METSAAASNAPHSGICVVSVFRNTYQRLVKAASLLQSPLLLIVRLYWGWQFFEDGLGKLQNHDKVAGFFQGWHVPFPSLSVYMAASTQCVGGLLLLIGLASRLVSLPLIFVMIIAYVTAESEALKSIFSNPDKFLSADPFLFLMASVIVLVFGPGKFSMDWLLSKMFAHKNNTRDTAKT